MIKFKKLLESNFTLDDWKKLDQIETSIWSNLKQLKQLDMPELSYVLKAFDEALSDLTEVKDSLKKSNNLKPF
jgi:hypothetical protein